MLRHECLPISNSGMTEFCSAVPRTIGPNNFEPTYVLRRPAAAFNIMGQHCDTDTRDRRGSDIIRLRCVPPNDAMFAAICDVPKGA